MKNSRTATLADFIVGARLTNSEGYDFIIRQKNDNGIWEARGCNGQGMVCIFENEAKFYTIKNE